MCSVELSYHRPSHFIVWVFVFSSLDTVRPYPLFISSEFQLSLAYSGTHAKLKPVETLAATLNMTLITKCPLGQMLRCKTTK